MSRSRFVLLLLLLTSGVVSAKNPWHYPLDSHHSYVNPFLTPARALQSWQPRFEGQLVLWRGTALKVQRQPPQRLTLRLENGKSVEVKFSRTVKNLQVDRQNTVLAIKGHLRRTAAGKVYLEGRSVIPWGPPKGFKAGTPVIDQWVAFSRPELSLATRKTIADAIRREAKAQGIDPLFLTALIQIESGFDPNAVSVSGALGLGQLLPETARGMGVDATDIKDNVRGCASMIGGLLKRYQHRPDGRALALASYNAGPALVAETLRVPPYEETVNYVYFIGSLYQELKHHQKRLSR